MKAQKPQLLYIHGGTTFKTKSDFREFLNNMDVSLEKKEKWSDSYLDKKLGHKCDIIRARMPCKENASYKEWKILFEKYLELLGDDYILVGNSLGGVFLAKYLSENTLHNTPRSVYLIAPPFDDTLEGEDLAGGFRLKSDLSLLEKNASKLTLLFSKTDDVVSESHAKKYRKKLPNASVIVYDDMNGHFQLEKFPDLVKMVKSDLK